MGLGGVQDVGAILHDLHAIWRARDPRDEYIGTLVDAYLALGGRARGVKAGHAYVDVGTFNGYRAANLLLEQRRDASVPDSAPRPAKLACVAVIIPRSRADAGPPPTTNAPRAECHSAARAFIRSPANRRMENVCLVSSGRSRRQTDSALPWTLSFLRPYRRAVARLVALSIGEIALRALAPWPLKAIVDFLTRGAPPVAAVPRWVDLAAHPIALLGSVVAAGLLLQIGHELVLLAHTRVQARLAQRMVFDLRSRLFTHLQYLSLAHHAVGSTADSVYRLDTDAGCLESLLLKGLFPLVFSALTLVVMFGILIELDPLLALICR